MLNDIFHSIVWSEQRWRECLGLNLTLVSRVPEDVQHKVPRHWHQFEAPHPLWQPILGTFYILIGAVAMMGNSLVLWIFGTTRSLRCGTNLLVMNLALTDLLMVLTQFPVLVANCYNHRWTLGPAACEIYGFCGALFGTVSIITMALIALDRYFAIVNPYSGWRLSYGKASVWVGAAWSYGVLWCIPPLVGWNQYVLEGFLTSCTFDYLSDEPWSRLYVFLMFMFAYVIPLAVISWCYSCIYFSVSRHDRRLIKENQMAVNSLNIHQRETQLARVVLTSVGFWTMAWTPYAVVALLGVFSWSSALTPINTMLPALFAKLSTLYNPFIYAVSHHRYRQEVARRLPWLCWVMITERHQGMPSTLRSPTFLYHSDVVSHTSSFRTFSKKEKAVIDLPSADNLASSMARDSTSHSRSTDL
ncbi:rhodopsin-like [Panulirus ornatus]|uniref:rhodopsin-like n=1 Tax=Panulirus ornatus TaxID=150431 RepID=UPI003A8C2ABD